MIFWIVLMLIGVALIGALCVSVVKTKKEKEYKRLEAVYKEKYSNWETAIGLRFRQAEHDKWDSIDKAYDKARKDFEVFKEKYPNIQYREQDRAAARNVFFVIAGVLGFIALIMALIIMVNSISAPEQRARLEVEGQMIQEALNAGDYEELIAINGTADAFTAAKDYNIAVRGGQVGQNNFWYGIFVPDIYDGLEMVKIPQK